MRFPLLAGAVLCAVAVSSVHAIHPDQAGVIDWHLAHVGPVSDASYLDASHLLLSSHATNAFAALDAATSKLAWRQVLDGGETLDTVSRLGLLRDQQAVATMSSNDGVGTSLLRLWNAGSMLWETPVAGKGAKWIIAGGSSASSASATWLAMEFADGKRTAFDARNGKPLAKDVLPAAVAAIPTTAQSVQSADNVLAYVSYGSLTIQSLAEDDAHPASSVSLNAVSSAAPFIAMNVLTTDALAVTVSDRGAVEFFVYTRGGALERKHVVHAKSKLGVATAFASASTGWVVYHSEDGAVTVETIAFADKITSTNTLAAVDNAVPVKSAYGQAIGPTTFQLILIREDESVSLIDENMVTLWTREESLALSTHSEFVDLPEKLLLQQHQVIDEQKSIIAQFIERDLTVAVLPVAHAPTDTALSADRFGFRKLLLVATAVGKLFAIRTDSGAIVWSRCFTTADIQSVTTVRGVTVRVPPVVVVTTKSAVYRLNALTGEALAESSGDEMPLPFAPLKVLRLPAVDATMSAHVLAMIGDDQRVALYPDDDETVALVRPHLSTLYYHTGGKLGDNFIAGYSFVEEQSRLHGVLNWKLEFPAGEVIVGVADKLENEKVATTGRVLGDRSVLYKYLNPNALAFATANVSTSTVTLYVMDLVSGAIIYRVKHAQAATVKGGDTVSAVDRMPVYVAQSENWVVYHLWAKQSRERQVGTTDALPEVHVLELYESALPDERVESTTASAFVDMRPHVIADSFIFHGDITAIGVTDTRSGITTREVLFATANGQLHAVSRMLLDARRPHKLGSAMTTEEREEMLVPYQPTIDVHPKEVLSYTLDVRNVRAITTSRTTIESTTLIFARGLDLFFTRRMPSKSFDVLGEEFSRGMLLMLMGSLAAGIIVAKHMVAEKKLNKAWE